MWSEWTHRLPNIALYGRVEGKRVKGRPRKHWLDNVTDDCYHRGWSIVEATHLATNRQRWRTYIPLSHRHDNEKKKKKWSLYTGSSRMSSALVPRAAMATERQDHSNPISTMWGGLNMPKSNINLEYNTHFFTIKLLWQSRVCIINRSTDFYIVKKVQGWGAMAYYIHGFTLMPAVPAPFPVVNIGLSLWGVQHILNYNSLKIPLWLKVITFLIINLNKKPSCR